MRIQIGWMLAVSMAISPGAAAAAPLPSTGTISVTVEASAPAETLAVFSEALAGQLSGKGFTILKTPGHAALVAHLHLSRRDLGTVSAKSGRAAPNASVGFTSGVSLPFGRSGSHEVALQQTRLDVGISTRGDDRIVWQGSATTVRPADTLRGGDDAVAQDLSEAALRGFPNQAGAVVSVP